MRRLGFALGLALVADLAAGCGARTGFVRPPDGPPVLTSLTGEQARALDVAAAALDCDAGYLSLGGASPRYVVEGCGQRVAVACRPECLAGERSRDVDAWADDVRALVAARAPAIYACSGGVGVQLVVFVGRAGGLDAVVTSPALDALATDCVRAQVWRLPLGAGGAGTSSVTLSL